MVRRKGAAAKPTVVGEIVMTVECDTADAEAKQADESLQQAEEQLRCLQCVVSEAQAGEEFYEVKLSAMYDKPQLREAAVQTGKPEGKPEEVAQAETRWKAYEAQFQATVRRNCELEDELLKFKADYAAKEIKSKADLPEPVAELEHLMAQFQNFVR